MIQESTSLKYQLVTGTCFSQNDATVKCWGENEYGQLGLGDTSHRGDDADGLCPPIFPTKLSHIESCITQLKTQGPARTCSESKEEEEDIFPTVSLVPAPSVLTHAPALRVQRWGRTSRGTVCGTLRKMCGADAGCLAINYQSVCRDGGEAHGGRPGGWEDSRVRQRWGASYVRCAGKLL